MITKRQNAKCIKVKQTARCYLIAIVIKNYTGQHKTCWSAVTKKQEHEMGSCRFLLLNMKTTNYKIYNISA